jgi:hypothetical protein
VGVGEVKGKAMTDHDIYKFVRESNEIERIFRDPILEEIEEFKRFVALPRITIDELLRFLKVYQPDARLRDIYGLNVRVGRYYPPFGGPDIRPSLERILNSDLHSYHLHIEYEKLHPFTDGNGRSGRALWAWKNKDIAGGFLLNFYFQTLTMSGGS